MDIVMYKRAIEYIGKLFEDPESIRRFDGIADKPAPLGEPIVCPFKRATPESVGVESTRVAAFLEELRQDKELHPHLLMIVKDDKMILDHAEYPYRSDVWHISHSLCKSITALGVGLAIEDGALSLDDKLWSIFKKRPFSLDFARQNDITVRHLLTMTAGVSFNELGCVTYEDYAEGFFTASVKFTPGTRFMYNSMNSYMLSAAIRERTGRDMLDLLKERLFDPMGIREIYWEKCPRGITKGGWGLYMKLEDTMKFGKLLLDGGLWQGKRLISKDWITEITKKQVDSSPAMCDNGYGYHLWRSVREGSYQFNGMLGQNLIVFPDIHMVIGFHAGNSEFFPKSRFVSLVGKHFGDGFAPVSPRVPPCFPPLKGRLALGKALKNAAPQFAPFYKRKEHQDFLRSLDGRRFKTEPKKLFLLPLALSVLQMNFTSAVKAVGFSAGRDGMTALFHTANGVLSVPFDVYGRARYFTLSLGGDCFSAASLASVAYRGQDAVLTLTLHYLELTSARRFAFVFGEKPSASSREIPDGKALLDGFAPMIDEAVGESRLLRLIAERADGARLGKRMSTLFEAESSLTELPR